MEKIGENEEKKWGEMTSTHDLCLSLSAEIAIYGS